MNLKKRRFFLILPLLAIIIFCVGMNIMNSNKSSVSLSDKQDDDIPDIPMPNWKIQIITGISDGNGTFWNYLMDDAEPYIEHGVMMIPFEAFAEAFGYEETAGLQSCVIKNGTPFISLRDVSEKFGLNTDWWYSDLHETDFVWITDRALLEETDYHPDDNYDSETEELDDYIVHEYTLKTDGRTYRNITLHDTYDKVIESYGLPTRIFHANNKICYDFHVFPDGNTDESLYFSFEDGIVERISIVTILEN